MSRRTERIGSVIRNIVSEAIQTRLADPRLEPLTSITHVDVSAISAAHQRQRHGQPRRPETRRRRAVQRRGGLRAAVADQVHMRQVPRLEFVLDDSLKQAFETVQAIDQAMAELGQKQPWEDEAEDADAAEADEEGTTAPDDSSSGPAAEHAEPRPRSADPSTRCAILRRVR